MSECPFCSRDPFHYVDNGIGMEAVAVTCCELGDLYFRGARQAPEEITLSWKEFVDIGAKLASAAASRDAAPDPRDKLIERLVAALRMADIETWRFAYRVDVVAAIDSALEYAKARGYGRDKTEGGAGATAGRM